ncbi:CoA-binding protein [Maribacter sp. 2304DJ31-5]|uniref:CoA-binding protein n=1 Tax=Maribacter sp. 2304DJ31-5 TaxID=3386273 RepID=UPI0039BD1177
MKKTLVFGASLKPNRYSNLVLNALIAQGIETVAFGVRPGEVTGVQVKTNLNDFQNIHTITLYLNPGHHKEYYDAIVELRPKRIIFNPGTENPEFYTLLIANKIQVEEACTLVLLATGQF